MHNFVAVVTSVEHHLTIKVLGFLCFTQERVTEEGKFTSFHLLTSGNSSDGLAADCRKGVAQSLAVSFSVILCIIAVFLHQNKRYHMFFLLFNDPSVKCKENANNFANSNEKIT